METPKDGASFTLRDGTAYFIRPLRPDDAPRLQALHSRLSAESIRLRFMAAIPVLSQAEAQRLADIDGRNRMALVAVRPAAGGADEQFIGVARYAVMGPQRPGQAEAAVVVEDRYQSQGVGLALLDQLLDYARSHGIRWFVAEVSFENDRMIRFIRRSGLPVETHLADGVLEVKVEIAPGSGDSSAS